MTMNSNKKALICGISGQDGAYLTQFLLEKGYKVYGSSRDAQVNTFINLKKLGILDQIQTLSMALTDFRSVYQAISHVKPDEIYNLAGQSSVGLSFNQPVETIESITIGTINILESIRFLGIPIKFYNASSSECFGDTNGVPADEATPFRPRSPYAVAKASAHWIVANYREAYDLFASNGILFNHESPLRPERFVTQKIVKTACRISKGSPEKLSLGNINIKRDWGWAPEYVQAMWRMLQQPTAEDFVIATGETKSLIDFISTAFETLGMNWKEHVEERSSLYRNTDISTGCANPNKARKILRWSASFKMKDVVNKMVESELNEYEH